MTNNVAHEQWEPSLPPFTKKGGGFENYSLNKISYGMPLFINGVVESKGN